MITPKQIEKRINKELTAIKKVAIKEVVKAGVLVVATLAGATAVVSLLAKDENEGVQTENYTFGCFGLSATNDEKMVVVTLEETNKLAQILKDYHWIKASGELGKVVITNGKETIIYNEDTGVFVNEARGCMLMLNNEHREKVNTFFVD